MELSLPTTTDILDLLRDPIWQAAGVITAVVLGLISVWLARRHYKDIYCKIQSATPIGTSGAQIKGPQVVLEGQIMEDTKLVLIEIKNMGNAPITSDDFGSPIRIVVESDVENARILDAGITDANPRDLLQVASLTFDSRSAELSPLLLNPRDSLTLKLITAVVPIERYDFGFSGLTVTGRIAGVKRIRNVSTFSLSSFILFILFCLTFGSYLAVIGTLITEHTSHTSIGLGVKVFGALFLVSGLYGVIQIAVPKIKKLSPSLGEILEDLFPPKK